MKSRAEADRHYQQQHRSHIAEVSHRYYLKHRKRVLERRRLWAIANREQDRSAERARRHRQPERFLLNSARQRARRKGLPFDLTISDVVIPSVCPVLKIPLLQGVGKKHDGSPTIDRVIPSRGYVHGNVHVISWRANSLKKDGTVTELTNIVEYINANS